MDVVIVLGLLWVVYEQGVVGAVGCALLIGVLYGITWLSGRAGK